MTKKMKKFFCFGCLGLSAFFYWQNNYIQTTTYQYCHKAVPKPFHGYKILHLSDLQSKSFGKNQTHLFRKIAKEKPDGIFFTGDLVDRNRFDLESAMVLVQQLVPLAPVYFVSGNHEYQSGYYDEVLFQLKTFGVTVLENDMTKIEKQGESLTLLGLADIRGNQNYTFVLNQLKRKTGEGLEILLSHRPELFPLYVQKGFDLVFSGHAHGGQINLPFLGPLFAPNQGLFPQYAKGVYEKKTTTMFVSRGLGNSRFPFRIFNRPEILVVILQNADFEKKTTPF